ncbi:MAG: hypothetical protein MHMPM18_002558, partial [Marteilia pararefringens]
MTHMLRCNEQLKSQPSMRSSLRKRVLDLRPSLLTFATHQYCELVLVSREGKFGRRNRLELLKNFDLRQNKKDISAQKAMKKEYRTDEPFNTTFKTLSGFNALRNLKRLHQSMQNIPIVLTGERLKDSSLLVYLPSSKTVDSVSEMDFQIAIESALFFAQLISGQSQSSLQLSIFLDCSKETNKDIVKKFDIMSRYQPNLTSIYILEPDKSFGNIFGGDSRHLLNSLKLSKCNVHIADSSSFKRLNLEANIVPVKFGGNRNFNTTIWTRAFTVFSNYLSKLLELYSQFDEHLRELEKISNIEEPQDLINFLKQEKNKRNSLEISYKIKEMLRNREPVLLYFSRTDFMGESPMIF